MANVRKIEIGEKIGVYKVLEKEGVTFKGTPKYKCLCLICGGNRVFSSSYLLNSKAIKKCICRRETAIREISREFSNIKKNYGKINLCGSCKHLFNCIVNRYNAIDPKFILKYKVESVPDRVHRRNIILVYDCTKFEFDWGEKKG